MASDPQRDQAAKRRQEQRTHVHEGRHQALVEKHQHREDQEDAGDERLHELRQELCLFPLLSGTGALHALRQIAERRQAGKNRVLVDHARREIGADQDAPLLIDALDDGRASAEIDVRDHAQRDRAAARGRHRHVLDGRQIAARILGQHDADRYLPVRQREAGAALVDFTLGRNPDRLAHRRSGHAHVGHEGEARGDGDFRTPEIAGDARRAKFGLLAHLLDDLQRGAPQLFRIGAGQQHGDGAAANLVLAAEEHARVRDILQLRPDLALEVGAGPLAAMTLRLEGDENGGVAGPDGFEDRADVGLAANQSGRLIGDGTGLLERHAGRHLHRDLDSVLVGVGLERAGQLHEHEDLRDKAEDTDEDRLPAVAQRPAQQVQIAVHQPAFAMLGVALRLQEIGGHHRRDQAGDEQADQHRDHDGQAEADEELPDDAAHERHRQEDGDDREGGRDHRQADLVGRVDRGLIGRFAHPHVPDDILDLHDRVVDQHAGHQAQREQGDHVEREAEQAHEPEGGDRRERDGDRGNERGAPVAQEQEDDDDGQQRALDQGPHRALILRLDIFHGREKQIVADARVFPAEGVQFTLDIVVDRDVRIAFGLLDHETDHLAAVLDAEGGLLGPLVADVRNSVEPDRAAASERDLGLGEIVGGQGAAEHAHGLFRAGNLGAAAGRVEVRRAQLLIDLAGGDALRLHAQGIQFHLDLAADPAGAADDGDAFDTHETAVQRVVDEPAKLLDRHRRAFRREIADGLVGEIDALDLRLQDAVGQVAPDAGDGVAHV